MTDDEYRGLLVSLAAKHVRTQPWLPERGASVAPANRIAPIQRGLDRDGLSETMNEVAFLVSLSKAAALDRGEGALSQLLARRLEETQPVQAAESAMRTVGILDAIDEARPVIFR
jgi:hypothetical protein